MTPAIERGDRTDGSGGDDAALVRRVAGRGPDAEAAMAELYRRYGPVVAGLARRVLGDRALADDVVQEVFVAFWRNAERFDADRGRVRTLLLTQTHGRCVDVIRSRNARTARETRVEREPRPPVDDVDAELMAIAEAEIVRDALGRLPDDERIVIELAYFGANTYRQVAAILGMPEGTIKGRIRRGLRQLHDLLAESPIELTTARGATRTWTEP